MLTKVFTKLCGSIWFFLPVWILSLAAFWRPLRAVVTLSLHDDRYSHLLLIPFVTIALIYWDRHKILREPGHSKNVLAGLFFAVAAVLYGISYPWSTILAPADQLWMPTLSVVLLWVAIFIFMNGPNSAAAVAFPLCFLVLMIPVTSHLLGNVVYALQKGSAEVTQFLFRTLGMPFLRQDFRFSLPGIEIEVAEECSGIRSSLALFITGTIAAHLFLQTTWKKLVFILFTIPVAIFKNGVRIATLCWLSVYVNRSYLDSPLHHRGGALFALVGFAILLPTLLLLHRWGADPRKTSPAFHPEELSDPLFPR